MISYYCRSLFLLLISMGLRAYSYICTTPIACPSKNNIEGAKITPDDL